MITARPDNFQVYLQTDKDLYSLDPDKPDIVPDALFQVPGLRWMEHTQEHMMGLSH